MANPELYLTVDKDISDDEALCIFFLLRLGSFGHWVEKLRLICVFLDIIGIYN